MKKRSTLLTLLVIFVLSTITYGQGITLRGRVISAEDGTPLPGVNVAVKGTSRGTTSDGSGNYQLEVPNGQATLVFSFIGFVRQEVVPGSRTTVNVELSSDATQLEEYVITALGVKREAKALPYAVQSISGDRISPTRQTDVNNALAGKIAGVQVMSQAGSNLGASTAIRIRGAGSLNDKAPLYVVDGTPVDGTNLFLSPDDMESITVLKGPNATALYGQRGDAGVVVITTKRAKANGGIGLEVNHTTTFERPSLLPKYQNVYGGGGDSEWQTFKWVSGYPEEWKALDGKRFHDYTDDASWGPKMDGGEYIPWYAWYPGTEYSNKTAAYNPQPDNVRKFYNTGHTYNSNVNFSKAGENFNVRLSYTNLRQTGVQTNTDLKRDQINLNSELFLNKHFTANASIQYNIQRLNGYFNDGYSNATTGSFSSWFHRDLDMDIVRQFADYRSPIGTLVSWNHDNPSLAYVQNGRFYKGNYWYNFFSYANNISNTGQKDLLLGNVSLTYKLDDHFRVSVIARRDQRNENYENKVPTIMELSGWQTGLKAAYGTAQITRREDNFEFLSAYNNTAGAFTFDFNLGGNIRKNFYRDIYSGTKSGLVVPDLYTLSNSRDAINYANYRSYKEVRSLYGRGTIGYKDRLFLDFSGRNDWSSALPVNNNSYFYPSVGLSVIFSEMVKIPHLSYGKLRASTARVGSDLDPYQLSLTYGVGAAKYGNNILMGTPDLLPNASIAPALSSSYEGGIDLKFLNNRVGLAATYYQEDKTNEILTVNIPAASGFSAQVINAGHIRRNGVELQLDVTPIRTPRFNWDLTVNWAANRSKVIELTPDVKTFTIPGYNDAFSFARVIHQEGQEWGQVRGRGIKYLDGQPVLNSDGTYQTQNDVYFGSVLPKFTGGAFTSLRFDDLTLTLSMDYGKGGKYFSLSNFWGQYSGLLAETAATNDKGMNVRDDVSAGGGVHVKGVNANGEPIDTYVNGYDYYHQFGNNGIAEASIFDATFVKMREINLGYNVPVRKIPFLNGKVRSASVSLVARNPWIIYVANPNFDASELAGKFGENGQLVGTRSMGFSVRLGF